MHNQGTHIILDGNNVNINFSIFDIPDFIKKVKELIQESGMTILDESFYDFENPK